MHPSAAVGFDRAADAYERGRPSFPAAAVEAISEALELGPGRTILDVGAGTGKMTKLLTPSGARVIAIEPVEAMRRTLRLEVAGIEVLDATAEAIPLAPGAADGAVAAQAFHWFDGAAALSELARIVPAGAGFAIVWNVRDESTAWVRRLTELIEPFRGTTPSHRSMRWRDAFDASADWTPPALTSFPYEHRTSREAVVDRVVSISFIAALDAPVRDAVAREVLELLPPGEEVTFPYRTDLWLSRRR